MVKSSENRGVSKARGCHDGKGRKSKRRGVVRKGIKLVRRGGGVERNERKFKSTGKNERGKERN